MNEYLNQLVTLCNGNNLTNRNAVLQIMQIWSQLKTSLLRGLRSLPTTTMQQQQNVQTAIDGVEVLHIWPWGGTLEDVLKNVGSETIVEHWGRCLNFTRDAIQTFNQQATQAQSGVSWPPR
jgi:hypothetical protein